MQQILAFPISRTFHFASYYLFILYHNMNTSSVLFIILPNQALLEEMPMRLNALESVQAAAQELIKQAGDSQDDAVKGKDIYKDD